MQSLNSVIAAWFPRSRTDAPCAVCGGFSDRRRGKLALCRDCHDASRPHRPSDPYDELGGGD